MRKAEWSKLWLAFRPVPGYADKDLFKTLALTGFDKKHPVIGSAVSELRSGIFRMLGIRIGMAENASFRIRKVCGPEPESYRLQEDGGVLTLCCPDESGVLYGVFAVLFQIAQGRSLSGICRLCVPDAPLRMLNHWDNADGSIERGYSGKSFFFDRGKLLVNSRTVEYARIVSSVAINAVVINNVNVKDEASLLITERYFEPLRKMAAVFGSYGIRLFLSLNYASCMEIGGLETCDPADQRVRRWWKERMSLVYSAVPGLGGFLVKADSEGRPGPFTYKRTQAEGANMLADAVRPYGGIIIWRCFVYNCRQDWRDRNTDRARAAYDTFRPLDGDFRENVILQIKNGPMDFQIREPVSPLFGGMEKTNQMLEVQIAQEYTGQQKDLCYLMPMFREVLGFQTFCLGSADCPSGESGDTVADIVSGRCFSNRTSGHTGIAAVANTGDDPCWTGNELAAANLYGFGRLAWDMKLTPEEIAKEWIRLTFSLPEEKEGILLRMLLASRQIYENYTAPLGIGWMVTPSGHYGPSVDGYEYSEWGTYHRADKDGLGVDRTDAGTAFVRQYHEPNASRYNNPGTCPTELILFFHHLDYRFILPDKKTVIQHIYDTHFLGYTQAEALLEDWDCLREDLDRETYEHVRERLEMQICNAREWRDQVNSYFYRKSGIADEHGRQIF